MLLPQILEAIRRNAPQLAHDAIDALRHDPHTRKVHGRSDELLEDRTREIYEQLSSWLAEKDERRVANFFSDVADRGHEREVPLAELVYALNQIKRTLWKYLADNVLEETVIGRAQLDDLIVSIGRFFDSAVYQTVLQYESRLTGINKTLL